MFPMLGSCCAHDHQSTVWVGGNFVILRERPMKSVLFIFPGLEKSRGNRSSTFEAGTSIVSFKCPGPEVFGEEIRTMRVAENDKASGAAPAGAKATPSVQNSVETHTGTASSWYFTDQISVATRKDRRDRARQMAWAYVEYRQKLVMPVAVGSQGLEHGSDREIERSQHLQEGCADDGLPDFTTSKDATFLPFFCCQSPVISKQQGIQESQAHPMLLTQGGTGGLVGVVPI
ncbi:hypothetical protein B0H14DRAFT_2575914 [Mycena olivaceomarginata]|nr:hypothetical protein B0H14DRAFT_2575914 [Mycena olivaceomarginata]